ncbi:hypothetical protein D3OALGB2SA_4406 [Olavius algarvensis associated proteobacterium Delta 3]|nr:hypothetical protein D3OALGB2SA_4406 [Olavius algarvensis associated proteobacterium Delta 3]
MKKMIPDTFFTVAVIDMFRLQKYGTDDRSVAEGAKELYFSQNP